MRNKVREVSRNAVFKVFIARHLPHFILPYLYCVTLRPLRQRLAHQVWVTTPPRRPSRFLSPPRLRSSTRLTNPRQAFSILAYENPCISADSVPDCLLRTGACELHDSPLGDLKRPGQGKTLPAGCREWVLPWHSLRLVGRGRRFGIQRA